MWAGKQWGSLYIPRIGQEAVVSFLDGDPDRPLIIGSVYNADQTVPYTLPDDQTKSTVKTNSSKGGSGFNEIRFEDKSGSEELFIQAQKDMNVTVLNDQTITVTNNRTVTVSQKDDTLTVSQGNRTVAVSTGNETHTVQGTRDLTITGNESHTNSADYKQTVSGNFTLKVSGDLTLDVSGAITIIRSPMATSCCTCMTSLVVRTMRDEVPIWSNSFKVKCSTWEKSRFRSRCAIPDIASDA
jgi:type VI secretion system secreted protein VgrG